jgi:hypothetical protein
MKEFSIPISKSSATYCWQNITMPAPDAEAFAHALMDIPESVVEIYDEFLPKLMEYLRTDAGDVQNAIWDICEACRHIDYHLKDAKLVPGA